MKRPCSYQKFLALSCLVLLFHILTVTLIKAQTVELVKDINPSGFSSIGSMIDLNGILIFSAYDTIHGSELWKSDGTNSGTALIKDINPGTANSSIKNFVYYNGKIYFSANDGTNGEEIWVTNGDINGTYMIKNINSTGGCFFSYPIVYKNLLFFAANDGVHGNEWWTTDGTNSGTQLLVDSSSASTAGPETPYIYNNKLFYSYNSGTYGYEPWVTDGTPTGTHLLLNINPNSNQGSNTEVFFEYNGLLFFDADNGVNGNELWVTDGTSSGTNMVKDIRPGSIGSFPRQFIIYNNLLFFPASDGTNGNELWASNGTPAGTYMFYDLNSTGSSDIIGFTEYDNRFFFSAIHNTYGREPWFCDGSDQGTQILKDINSSGNSMAGYLSVFPNPTVFDGKLYFAASDGSNGYELWLTDGTTSNTQTIEPFGATGNSPFANTNQFVISSGNLFFGADYSGSGEDLYKIAGSSGIKEKYSGIEKLKIYPIPSVDNFSIEFTYRKSGNAEFELINIYGQTVWQDNFALQKGDNSIFINCNGKAPGVYSILITTDHEQVARKIIIQ